MFHPGEILIEERLAEADSGIGEQCINRPVADRGAEFVDAFRGGQIGLKRLNVDAEPAQIDGRALI